MARVQILVASILIISASGIGGQVAEQVHERDQDWIAPESNASRSNPLAARPDAAAGGAKLFRQRCTTCHGRDGSGTARAPDLALPEVQAQTDGALFWKISSGNARQGMPTFSFLPEPQRWQLVLHLRTLKGS
jgi:mono/diheme cytochrome c family protein